MEGKKFHDDDFGYPFPGHGHAGNSQTNLLYNNLASASGPPAVGSHSSPMQINIQPQPVSNGPQSAWVPLSTFPTQQDGNGTKVRLRATKSKAKYTLKSVGILKWLVLVQAGASGIIMLSQVLLYATLTGRFDKPVLVTGIGIWAPIAFFSIALGLTYLAIKAPSGCTVGTAMGFQIVSTIIGGVLLILSIITLCQHGYSTTNYYSDDSRSKTTYTYDPEVPGRVFSSFMILCAGAVMITAVFISVTFCRVACCGRKEIDESIIFDVEMETAK